MSLSLKSLTLYRLNIPFHQTFRHASANRTHSNSLLVRAETTTGLIGLGEGCPRDYVTGESSASATTFFQQQRSSLMKSIHGLDDLKQWCLTHSREIDKNPAAFCAIELALLDVLAQHRGQSLEALLGIDPLAGPFSYTAVLGDNELPLFTAQLNNYRQYKFADYKIKLSGQLQRDKEKLVLLTSLPAKHIRLDANNLWQEPMQVADYLAQLPIAVRAIEEPLKPRDFTGMAQLLKRTSTDIILDESCLHPDDIKTASRLCRPPVVNLRVSKLGGLLRTLTMIECARQHGLAVIIGAQVGETSLLTRAGLSAAQAARDILFAQEGAYGTYLLQHDLCWPSLSFGHAGKLTLPHPALRHNASYGCTFEAIQETTSMPDYITMAQALSP